MKYRVTIPFTAFVFVDVDAASESEAVEAVSEDVRVYCDAQGGLAAIGATLDAFWPDCAHWSRAEAEEVEP